MQQTNNSNELDVRLSWISKMTKLGMKTTKFDIKKNKRFGPSNKTHILVVTESTRLHIKVHEIRYQKPIYYWKKNLKKIIKKKKINIKTTKRMKKDKFSCSRNRYRQQNSYKTCTSTKTMYGLWVDKYLMLHNGITLHKSG